MLCVDAKKACICSLNGLNWRPSDLKFLLCDLTWDLQYNWCPSQFCKGLYGSISLGKLTLERRCVRKLEIRDCDSLVDHILWHCTDSCTNIAVLHRQLHPLQTITNVWVFLKQPLQYCPFLCATGPCPRPARHPLASIIATLHSLSSSEDGNQAPWCHITQTTRLPEVRFSSRDANWILIARSKGSRHAGGMPFTRRIEI